MPTPATRAPAYGSPRPPAVSDPDEQEDEDVGVDVGELPPPIAPITPATRTRPYQRPYAAAPAKGPVTGTTGGIVPQGAGTWDRAPQGRLSDDPRQRAVDSVAQAEADFAAKQHAENPFLFSGAVKSLAKEGGRRYLDRAVREGDAAYSEQVMQDRAAAVAQRRDEVEQQKAVNADREAKMRGSGQMSYKDPFGNRQPVLSPDGRPLYHKVPQFRSIHPKTGIPVKESRDQYGQRQFENYPLVTTDDPRDMQMHWNVDGEFVPAMSIEDAIKQGGAVGKKARTAQLQKLRGQKEQEVAQSFQEKSAVDLEAQTAASNADAMLARSEALAATDPTGAQKLATEAYAIQESLNPRTGELAFRKNLAAAKHAVATARANRDGYELNQQAIAERLMEQGIDPETDELYKQNKIGYATFQRGLATAEAALANIEGLRSAPVPAAPVAPVATTPIRDALANTGLAAAKGATSEGIYAASEGASRVFSQSPVRRGLESLEDWATEKIQGFPLTEQQKATRQKLRQRAAEQTGSATVDRFAKDYADATATLRTQIRNALPVDQKFAESLPGQIAQGAGQLIGTAAAAIATGGVGIAGTSIGQIYDEGYQDAVANGASPEQAHSAAMKYLPAASLDFLADKLVIGKLLKPLVGKMTVGRFLKDVVLTAAAEGGTEGAQQAYLNQIASKLEGYDPDRPFDKEVLDSVIVGAVLGGGATVTGTGARTLAGEGREGPATPPAAAPVGPDTPGAAPVADQSDVAAFNEKLAAIPGGPEAAVQPSSQQQEAEAELQRRLEASDLTPEERQEFDRLRAEGEPVGAMPTVTVAGEVMPEQAVADLVAGTPNPLPTEAAAPREIAPESLLSQDTAAELAQPVEPTPNETPVPTPAEPAVPTPEVPPSVAPEAGGNGAPREAVAGRPPVETDSAKIAADRAEYDRIQAEMRTKEPLSEEYNALWQASEDIKNRHGGYVPEVAGASGVAEMTVDEAPAPKSYGEKYITEQGVDGAERRIAVLNKLAEQSKDVRQVENLRDEAANLRRAIEKQSTPATRLADVKKRRSERTQPAAVEPAPAVSAPPVSTPELRKNNADLGLPPISSMKRPALRAELEAAGIKTVAGTPLAENENSAQLMNAVGKVRRGELTAEGERPSTTEPRKSDKIIAALQKAKIDTRGKAFDVTAGLPVAAYNAALDLAIVAIRAGRTVAEAVRLAVARYRAVHKTATDEDVAKLTKAINEAAVTPPEPTATQGTTPAPDKPTPSGQTFTGPVNPGSGEFRKRSKSSLGEYDYVATTNSGQEKYAKEFADWHEKNGTSESAMAEMRSLNEPAMRAAVGAELLGRTMEQWQKANVADKPMLMARAASLMGDVKAEKTEAGQALQSQAMVNKKLMPYAPLLSWMDFLRTRYETEIAPQVGEDAAGKVKKGINDAGQEATDALKEALGEKPSKRAQAEAERIVNMFAKAQSDTQAWADPAKTGPVKQLVAQYITGKITPEAFTSGLTKMGVSDATGGVLKSTADREIKTRDFAKWSKNQEALNEWLSKHASTIDLIRKAVKTSGQSFADIFNSLPESQEARKAELLARIKADPKFKGASEPLQKKLADNFDDAWTFLRNGILRREFSRLIDLPGIAKEDVQKVKSVVGDLIKYSNLGLLDNSAFLAALADKYGMEKLDGPTAKKLTEIAGKIQNAKNDAERARANIEMFEEVGKSRGLTVADAAVSGFYSNMLNSLVTTAYAMAGGNMINTVWNLGTLAASSPLTAAKTAGAIGRGFKTGVPEGLRQALSIMTTGHGGEDAAAALVEARGEPLEMLAKGGVWKEWETKHPLAAKGVQIAAHAAKMVPRTARALDVIAYYPSKQAALRFLTEQSLLAQYPDATTRAKKAAEILKVTPADFMAAEKKAKDEGFSGIDMSLRMADILSPKSALMKIKAASETQRYLTQQRREAQEAGAGSKKMEEATRFGAKTTLSQEPEGWAGVLYHGFSNNVVGKVKPGGFPILKVAFPFLRLPTNFYNANIDSLVGGFKAFQGSTPTTKWKEGKNVRRKFSDAERGQLYMQSLIGSTAMAYFVLRALSADPDDEEAFDITANGPADQTLRRQMENSGWKRKSFRVPGTKTRIDYQNAPFAMPLTLAGHIADAYRFAKTKDELVLGNALTDAAVRFPSVVFGLPALSGMQQLGDLLDEERTDVDKVTRFMMNAGKNFVRPRLIDEVDRIFDPIVRRDGVVQYDELGDPIERSPLDRIAKTESEDPLRQVLLHRKLKIPAAGRDTAIDKKPMTPEQYSEYVRLSGQRIRLRLTGMVPLLRTLDTEKAQERIEDITRDERARAKSVVRRMPAAKP